MRVALAFGSMAKIRSPILISTKESVDFDINFSFDRSSRLEGRFNSSVSGMVCERFGISLRNFFGYYLLVGKIETI